MRSTTPWNVLWRQNLSQYVPPVILSGWVAGRAMTRYYGRADGIGSASHDTPPLGESAASSLLRRIEPRCPLPSPAVPVTVENVSDGTSLLQVTPCCAEDTEACLWWALQRSMGAFETAVTPTGGGNGEPPSTPLQLSREATVRPTDAMLSARQSLRTLLNVVKEHSTLLAGASALQLGTPLRYTLHAIDEAVAYLQCAVELPHASETQWQGDGKDRMAFSDLDSLLCSQASGQRACKDGRVKDSAPCDTWGTSPVGLHRPVFSLTTVSPFALPDALKTATLALLCGASDVVWCPRPDSALPALWLMHLLRENARRRGSPPQKRSASQADLLEHPSKFHVLLAGAADTHLYPPLRRCRLPRGTRSATVPPLVVYRGASASEMTELCRALNNPRNSVKPLHTPTSASRIPARQGQHTAQLGETASVEVLSTFPSHATVAVAVVQGESTTVTEPSHMHHRLVDASTALAEWIFRHACCPCPVPPSAGTATDSLLQVVMDTLSCNSSGAPPAAPWPSSASHGSAHEKSGGELPPAVLATRRGVCPPHHMPLVFLPCHSLLLPTLQQLAHVHLGHSLGLGHSLDPTTLLGPLSSYALLHAVKDTVHRAVSGAPPSTQEPGHASTARKVRWRQVCGGFEMPLTTTASSHASYYVPCVLHHSLPSPNTTQSERGASDSVAQAAYNVCQSVSALLTPLQTQYGAICGGRSILFVCGYEDGTVEDVLRGVREVLRAAPANAASTKTLACPPMADVCVVRTARDTRLV